TEGGAGEAGAQATLRSAAAPSRGGTRDGALALVTADSTPTPRVGQVRSSAASFSSGSVRGSHVRASSTRSAPQRGEAFFGGAPSPSSSLRSFAVATCR